MLIIKQLLVLAVCLTFVALTPANATEKQTKQDLTQIQKTLENSVNQMNSQQKKIKGIENKLKKSELEIANNSKSLNELDFSIELNRSEQHQLNKKIKELKLNKSQQQKALSSQLKSAYMTGSHDYSKLLLNQEDIATFERTLTYYSYLNKARLTQLEQLKITLQQLATKQDELAKVQIKLTYLLETQKKKQELLMLAQKQRKDNLNLLKKQFSNTITSVEYLKKNEQLLIETLKTLQQQVKQQLTFSGLKSTKGKLNWPSRGRLKHRFGQRKYGRLKWKGVLINAKEGASVTTIHNGRVIFADWLKGFGWVIVIDHGEGFMSLYGHNQALLKNVGEQVSQGELIALVGQSGGQDNPGLYFEIRHKGQAINPIKWCKRI
ncbi:murein hydrolase activator EnvC family protein [Pseudoalteromonas denitrificans]|jgi:septal ring factor EnvC (AmiA/AmiB activator)|uniref:Septal ring factor EnvC, activator of murein hydrolases AmiA and AmiB n=1 Tax=Pseudoalteromonas denitrificans DSM 6059 TaxID=1123010 RepID=A0A1I1P694_9GAMM|nr:peptidoglycan DD-metalloendopeptidase family protein [Pseudoalteromonas denitrificans]SFD02513.1 Septal ring factor EnvC, activator of murein hydrolases AmiA and AmiB [Pseudoalteromonas denitrificans DSM 6059]